MTRYWKLWALTPTTNAGTYS